MPRPLMLLPLLFLSFLPFLTACQSPDANEESFHPLYGSTFYDNTAYVRVNRPDHQAADHNHSTASHGSRP